MSEDLKKILPLISDSYKWKNTSKTGGSDNKKKQGFLLHISS